MSDAMRDDRLRKVLRDHFQPPPELIGKLPRGGAQLDFLGHADVTRILIEEDPEWSWEPLSLDGNGAPYVGVVNDTAYLWVKLTVHGHTRIEVGTASAKKPDVMKELVGDALRRAAMRFGIALALWSKSEWSEPREYTKAQAKGVLFENLKLSMSELEAKARAAVLWENHAPKGDGPFTELELAGVFAAASTPEDAA